MSDGPPEGSQAHHPQADVEDGLALGASRWNVVREALRGTARSFAAGLATGLATVAIAARALDHLAADLLIGLEATGATVVAASTVALLTIAALAAILPALRAARVDPLTAIRGKWQRRRSEPLTADRRIR